MCSSGTVTVLKGDPGIDLDMFQSSVIPLVISCYTILLEGTAGDGPWAGPNATRVAKDDSLHYVARYECAKSVYFFKNKKSLILTRLDRKPY